MRSPSDIIFSHRDLDLAIARLARTLKQVERGLPPREARLADALDRLAEALVAHFRIEDEISAAACDMFGHGIPETDALSHKRGEIWSTAEELMNAPSDAGLLVRLRRQFVEYTDLEWRFLRNYSGLLQPGTAGA